MEAPRNTICEISADDFWTQKLKVGNVKEHSWEYCKLLSIGKKVLHIGCSDYPIFDGKGINLHIHLSKFTLELHGCDPNGLDNMKQLFDGTYYRSIDEVIAARQDFDVILVPNIIEHLKNPGLMIEQLFKIKFKTMFVLVPTFFISSQAEYENEIFTEKIHPDHYAWYSPYTLWNLFKKSMEQYKCDCELNFLDNKNMISILITNNQ